MSTDTDTKFTDDIDQGDTNTETVQTVQDQFEVHIRREPSQSTMTGYVGKLDIISPHHINRGSHQSEKQSNQRFL